MIETRLCMAYLWHACTVRPQVVPSQGARNQRNANSSTGIVLHQPKHESQRSRAATARVFGSFPQSTIPHSAIRKHAPARAGCAHCCDPCAAHPITHTWCSGNRDRARDVQKKRTPQIRDPKLRSPAVQQHIGENPVQCISGRQGAAVHVACLCLSLWPAALGEYWVLLMLMRGAHSWRGVMG